MIEDVSEQKSWFARNWKWFVPVLGLGGLLGCVAFIGIITTVVFGAIKSSDAYQQAISIAEGNSAVVEVLGTPIQPGFMVSGSINVSGPSGNADIAIPVSGPNGSGTIYVVAIKSAGIWEFTTLQLAVDNSDERINLLSGQ